MAKGTKKPAQGNTKGHGNTTKPAQSTKGCGTNNSKGCGK